MNELGTVPGNKARTSSSSQHPSSTSALDSFMVTRRHRVGNRRTASIRPRAVNRSKTINIVLGLAALVALLGIVLAN